MRHLSDIVCNQRPLKLGPSNTVKDACESMRDRKVGAVLVCDDAGSLVGIFTGRDAVNRIVAAGKSPAKTRLKDAMTRNPTTMSPEMTAIDALRLMWDGGFRHVPVVKNEKIVGIVSRGDFKANEQDRFEEERALWEHMR
ncbi:MAG TPA: CBS domain-containing protein [Micropepsaceae bacterium]|nr:CBS domain-containing protein [Micropepsaceae bacterium]